MHGEARRGHGDAQQLTAVAGRRTASREVDGVDAGVWRRPAAGEEGDGPIRLLPGVPADDARRGGRGGLGGAPGLHGGARERPERRRAAAISAG